MEDLGKINSIQLYSLWKNLTVGLISILALMMGSRLLPPYLSPVLALLCAAALYTYIYECKARKEATCLIVPIAFLYVQVIYAFISILLNILYAWGVKSIPFELTFYTQPYLPSLIIMPVCFVVFFYVNMKRKRLRTCIECKLRNGDPIERGALGSMLNHEAHIQFRNLTLLFAVMTAIIWAYYLIFYVNINVNGRDWYIFSWMTTIFVLFDEIYFIARYYNLYLDLKENNEIISPEEIQDMTAKTYLRFYVVCGNNIYVDAHAVNPKTPWKEVIDTPFFTKRTVNGIAIDEVKRIIKKMTGYDGELRFFFGRKSSEYSNHSLLRYFYFLDGTIDQYQNMNTEGEWMDYEKIKYLYSNNPGRLADISVSDTTRLATIILTEKVFDENGYRKSKIKMYNPSFNLIDVRKSNLDFQDDKWIRISMFNSDTPFYSLKRKWRAILGEAKK